MVEFLFVHGALVTDGAWWWRPVAERLASHGIESRAVALPSTGDDGPARGGLVEDTAALAADLDTATGGAIVVGHSYGGTVIAEGADHPNVCGIVLVSSYLPFVGSSQADIVGSEADPVRVAPDPDGLLRLVDDDPETFAARFLQDVPDAATRAGALARVTGQVAGAFTTPTSREAWRGIDSTYLVCTEDRSTSLGLQTEHASRASRRIEMPTGHHPFLSRPDLVVAALLPLADRSVPL